MLKGIGLTKKGLLTTQELNVLLHGLQFNLKQNSSYLLFYLHTYIAYIFQLTRLLMYCFYCTTFNQYTCRTVRFPGSLWKFQTQVTQHTRRSNLYTLYQYTDSRSERFIKFSAVNFTKLIFPQCVTHRPRQITGK